MIDSKKAKGFLTAETTSGDYLSVTAFCREYFPFDDALLLHVLIVKRERVFLGSSSILKSFPLICKYNSIYRLISRHTSEYIEPLFMLLNLGFKVIEFSNFTNRHVIIEKKFEKKTIDALDLGSNFTIRDFYKYSSKLFPKTLVQDEVEILSYTDINLIKRWLGIQKNISVKKSRELELLLERQKYLEIKKLTNDDGTIFIIENLETKSGLIFISTMISSRKQFIELYRHLVRNNNTLSFYTTANNDYINSVLFLSGYTSVSIVEKTEGLLLYKWEK